MMGLPQNGLCTRNYRYILLLVFLGLALITTSCAQKAQSYDNVSIIYTESCGADKEPAFLVISISSDLKTETKRYDYHTHSQLLSQQKGSISQKDFNALVKLIIEEYNFYSLAEDLEDKNITKYDCATESVEVIWENKQKKVGGYGIEDGRFRDIVYMIKSSVKK